MKELTADEIDIVIEALAVAASRRESQARAVKFGRHHDETAAAMRRLRFELYFRNDTTKVIAHAQGL